LLYDETAVRVDLEAIEKLCVLFDVPVGGLFERITGTRNRHGRCGRVRAVFVGSTSFVAQQVWARG
jgi:hypothetical protein